jgi:glucose/arabinose dehydrogenase
MRSSLRLAVFLLFAMVLSGFGAVLAQDAPSNTDWNQGAFPGGTPPPGQGAPAEDLVAQPGEGQLPGDPQVQLVLVTDQVAEPINVTAPNDGSGRVFVVEREGTIRIIDADGNLLEEPFLDISANVQWQFLEQGLLGMAFHPDYAENGIFYVNYTDLLRAGDLLTVQYQVSEDDPNVADPDTGLIVWWRPNPYANHLGGEIAFGPDGYLYIGHGDGGMEGDPLNAGQRLDTYLGKMLRIDVSPAVARAQEGDTGDGTIMGGGALYAIPPDNPFAEGDVLIDLFGATEEDFAQYHPTARPEIYDWGLRNPWQFSFDRETGDLWVGDVGQNVWEEVNYAPAGYGGGVNWGWKFLQGSHCFPDSLESCPLVGTLPVAEYQHEAEMSCTVVGGHVYRGADYESLNGVYFHGDYCSGKLWGIAPADDGTWAYQELLDTGLLLTGAGEDEAGNVYFTSCQCGYGQDAPNRVGAVWMLVSADQVPDGATTAPPDRDAPDATPAVGEGVGTPEATPPED